MVVREDAEVACPPYTAIVEDPLILIDFEWTSEGSGNTTETFKTLIRVGV